MPEKASVLSSDYPGGSQLNYLKQLHSKVPCDALTGGPAALGKLSPTVRECMCVYCNLRNSVVNAWQQQWAQRFFCVGASFNSTAAQHHEACARLQCMASMLGSALYSPNAFAEGQKPRLRPTERDSVLRFLGINHVDGDFQIQLPALAPEKAAMLKPTKWLAPLYQDFTVPHRFEFDARAGARVWDDRAHLAAQAATGDDEHAVDAEMQLCDENTPPEAELDDLADAAEGDAADAPAHVPAAFDAAPGPLLIGNTPCERLPGGSYKSNATHWSEMPRGDETVDGERVRWHGSSERQLLRHTQDTMDRLASLSAKCVPCTHASLAHCVRHTSCHLRVTEVLTSCIRSIRGA